MNEVQALIQVFQEEAITIVDQLALQLDAITNSKNKCDRIDHLKTILRLAHNLKGAALTVGFKEIETCCHAIEDLLIPFRDKGSTPTKAALTKTKKSLSELQQLTQVQQTSHDTASLDTQKQQSSNQPLPSQEPQAVNKSIRVETNRLDRMMSFAGEFLVAQAKLKTRNEDLKRIYEQLCDYKHEQSNANHQFNTILKNFETVLQKDYRELFHFVNLTNEMNIAMKQVRMMPLHLAAPSWRMIARECSRELDKDIHVKVNVGDIELDRNLLEQLQDPLLHIIRNAIDHGIEPAQIREEKHKDPIGNILIEASMQGAMVLLEISDDGGGFNVERIKQKALDHQFIHEHDLDSITDADITKLLFMSGFSTAQTVSNISGRGVGLDVVRKRIEELGGSVSIAPIPKIGGCTFQLLLPVSLHSNKGLLVHSGSSLCVIPTDFITSAYKITSQDIDILNNQPIIQLDSGEILNLYWLSDILDIKDSNQNNAMVVVLTYANNQLGLVINEVLEEEEYVSKKLPWNLKSLYAVNGAVILDDGTLAATLDVPNLFNNIANIKQHTYSSNQLIYANHKVVLVVDDSMTSRTLERNILQSAGYEVLIAVNGQEALDVLKHKSVNLVISDVQMPIMDGLTLTQNIRDNKNFRHLPILLVTNLSSPEDIQRGADVGADEYIVKGEFEQKQLLDAVARLI